MRFLRFNKAMKKFLEDHGLGQNFWVNKNDGIEQSVISRYMSGSRKPSPERLRFIYDEMNRYMKGTYPVTFDEFCLEPTEQAEAYLTRIYDAECVEEVFVEYYDIAECYNLNQWKAKLSYDYCFKVFKKKNYIEVVQRLSQVDNLMDVDDETICKIKVLLGRTHLQLGNYSLSVHHLEDAIQYCDQNHLAKYYLGTAYIKVMYFDEAVEMLKEVINSGKTNLVISSKIQLGQVYLNMGKAEEAVGILLKLIDVETPYQTMILNNIGECYFHLGKMEYAYYYYTKSTEYAKQRNSIEMAIPMISLLRLACYVNDHEKYEEYQKMIEEYKTDHQLSVSEKTSILIYETVFFNINVQMDAFHEKLNVLKQHIHDHQVEKDKINDIKLRLLEGFSWNRDLMLSEDVKDKIFKW